MNGAPVISAPIAICPFFMMYPIMVKIDFGGVLRTGRSAKPVTLTLVVNWLVEPFGLDLAAGETYGAGQVVLVEGVRMLEVPVMLMLVRICLRTEGWFRNASG